MQNICKLPCCLRAFLETALVIVGTVLETVVGTVVNYIGTVTFLFRGSDSEALKKNLTVRM